MPQWIAELANDPLWRPTAYAEWLLETVNDIQIAEFLGTDAQKQNCPIPEEAPAVKPATAAVQEPKAEGPPATALRLSVKLPSRGEDLARWKKTWDELCKFGQSNNTDAEISKWLKPKRPRLHRSEDTLEKILRAGRLGLLDNITIQANLE